MNKKLIIPILILALALLITAGLVVARRVRQENGPPTPQATPGNGITVQPPSDKMNPDGTPVGGVDEPPEDVGSDETPPGTPTPVKAGESVGVTLSRATIGDKLLTVSGYAETATPGTCTLTLTQSGRKTLTYTSPAELEVSNVSCNPFRIPLSDFPTKGQWKAVIAFSGKGLSGTSNEWIVQL
jgi:hypothetical protein